MNKPLVVIATVLWPFFAVAQSPEIDSVLKVINTAPGDSTRAEAMADMAWLLKYSDPARAISFGFQSVALAEKNQFEEVKAHAFNSIGVTYWAKGNYDSARFFLEQVGEIYHRLNHKKGEAMSYTNLGLIFQNQGNYQKSLDYGLKGMRLLEELGDQSAIASSFLNVGNVYFLREEYPEAKKYYFRSLALKRELAKNVLNQNIQKTLGNIANVYQKLGQPDSAFYYFKAAIPFAKQANDLKNLCLAYGEIGLTFSHQGRYDSALHYYNSALAIYNGGKFSNDFDRATLLQSISQTYLAMGNTPTALRFAEESHSLAVRLNNANKLKEAYELLAIVYERAGRPGLALDAIKKFIVYKDSLMDSEKNKQIAEIQTKYETEKKDNQILILNQENELKQATISKNYWTIGALSMALGLLAMAALVWRNRQRRRQEAVQQEQKVRLREAQIRAEIESQEKERKRFASDMHDGIGQLVSALQINVQSLKGSADLAANVSLVENTEALLTDIQQEIRNIAFNLMPVVLVKEGLVSAIRELLRKVEKASAIKTEFSIHGLPDRLEGLVEISLYRILQELISNIIKHSHATRVILSITGHESEIVLTLEDNGDGFDVTRFSASTVSNGWRTIQTRVNLIQGQIEFDSQPGRKNTIVTLQFPLSVAVVDAVREIPTDRY